MFFITLDKLWLKQSKTLYFIFPKMGVFYFVLVHFPSKSVYHLNSPKINITDKFSPVFIRNEKELNSCELLLITGQKSIL